MPIHGVLARTSDRRQPVTEFYVEKLAVNLSFHYGRLGILDTS